MGTRARNEIAKVAESEAIIESAFRRLLASIESEREKMRSEWQKIESEGDTLYADLDRLRLDTEEWMHSEQKKIDTEWKRIDRLKEKMRVAHGPEVEDIIEINCSGQLFALPLSALTLVEGSFLNHMFSEAFVEQVPVYEGRYFVDFNPECFRVVIDYLQAWRERPDGVAPPIPILPPEQQMNMDLLVEALNLKCLMRTNSIQKDQKTSLRVVGNTITATHTGWQVTSAQYPMSMAGAGYFEVRVLANPHLKGGLAVGVCGHRPKDKEVHNIRLKNSVLYNSSVGLVGNFDMENVSTKGIIQLKEGGVIGVKFDVAGRSLHWFHNKRFCGTCSLSRQCQDDMQVLYPVVALHDEDQKVQVVFDAPAPTRGSGVPELEDATR